MKIIRRINTMKLKRIATLSGISALIILAVILLEPAYSFLAKATYFYLAFKVLLKLWQEGMRDWNVLVVA